MPFANTPQPPYYAVIFSNTRREDDGGPQGYAATAARMLELASEQPGFLGVEAVRDPALGITVSYWESEQAIAGWRRHAEHREAQRSGRREWYTGFRLRVARVERDYGFDNPDD